MSSGSYELRPEDYRPVVSQHKEIGIGIWTKASPLGKLRSPDILTDLARASRALIEMLAADIADGKHRCR